MKHFAYAVFISCMLGPTIRAQEAAPQRSPAIEFLAAEKGGNVIAGGDDDVFFSKLFPREAATMTQVAPDEKSVEETRQFAREFFRKAVLEFNDDEQTALRLVTKRIFEQFGDDYPILVRRRWRFIKIRKDLCGGFSFTRGDCIVLSESTIGRIVESIEKQPRATQYAEGLLLHEQMHVLQRDSPDLFKPLYEDLLRFRAAKVTVHPWIDQRQVTNPDGVSDDWVLNVPTENSKTQPFWIGTVLLSEKPIHTMGRDFTGVAVALEKNDADTYVMALDDEGRPVFQPLNTLTAMTSRLPIRGGYDHPNEVAAYLFTVITHGPVGRCQPARLRQCYKQQQRGSRST